MRVAEIVPASIVNGDGTRIVIVFQGCSLNCAGCFSPELQQFDVGKEMSPIHLAKYVTEMFSENKLLDGLTLSGGNPTEQFELVDFLIELRKLMPKLDICMWTGHTWEELNDFKYRHSPLPYIDMVISGRFEINKKVEHQYYGSSNQEVWRKNDNVWSKNNS